ncbi:hypothetical protein MXD58_025240, partial [Frankia sp. AgKG'84/4]
PSPAATGPARRWSTVGRLLGAVATGLVTAVVCLLVLGVALGNDAPPAAAALLAAVPALLVLVLLRRGRQRKQPPGKT